MTEATEDFSRPRMIIRTNLVSPDILIANDENFEENVKQVYNDAKNTESMLYIETDYLLFRL